MKERYVYVGSKPAGSSRLGLAVTEKEVQFEAKDDAQAVRKAKRFSKSGLRFGKLIKLYKLVEIQIT